MSFQDAGALPGNGKDHTILVLKAHAYIHHTTAESAWTGSSGCASELCHDELEATVVQQD